MARPRQQRTWTRTRIVGWGGLLVASLAGLVWLVGFLRGGTLQRNDQLASVAGIFVGLASLTVAVWSLRVTVVQLRQQPDAPADRTASLDQAADALATAVAGQWNAEVGLRRLQRPAPIRLAWTTTPRPVAAPAETIAGGALPGRVTRLRLHGHLEEAADKFLALRHRRLVVLAAPGGGKTVLAMLLTLALLDRRRPGDPVPVLLGLNSWDPKDQTTGHLHAWIIRRLEDDYPALRRTDDAEPDGATVARKLVTSGRILPVLDGLDELPEPLRATAIGELDRAHANRPLVLTCRGEEYEKAVAAGGGALTAAAVVELEPVTATQATGFLRAAAGPAVERWDQVAAHLRTAPEGALAAALSTPLMVALARTVYTAPGRDPAGLVTLAETGGQAAVERYLLNEFIPSAFTDWPPAPDAPPPKGHRSPSPDQARRWLAALADSLDRHHTRDLAWWQLPNLVPQRTFRIVLGITVGATAGLIFGFSPTMAGMEAIGAGFGLVSVVTAGLAARTTAPTVPAQRRRELKDLVRNLAVGAVIGCALGFVIGFVSVGIFSGLGSDSGLTSRFTAGAAAGTLFGLTSALIAGLIGRTTAPSRVSIRPGEGAKRLLRSLAIGFATGFATGFAIGLILGLVSGLPLRFVLTAGLLVGLPLGLLLGLVTGVVDGLTGGLQSQVDDTTAVTPRSVLRHDRGTAAVVGLVIGCGVGGVFGLTGFLMGYVLRMEMAAALRNGLVLCLTFGILTGVVFALGGTAWGRYTIVRTWLALRGRLPWRLTAFLADAHRRGVLRQVGAVYQFRHARLQDHLANPNRLSPKP